MLYKTNICNKCEENQANGRFSENYFILHLCQKCSQTECEDCRRLIDNLDGTPLKFKCGCRDSYNNSLELNEAGL